MRRVSNIRVGAGIMAAGIMAPSPMAVTHAALASIMRDGPVIITSSSNSSRGFGMEGTARVIRTATLTAYVRGLEVESATPPAPPGFTARECWDSALGYLACYNGSKGYTSPGAYGMPSYHALYEYIKNKAGKASPASSSQPGVHKGKSGISGVGAAGAVLFGLSIIGIVIGKIVENDNGKKRKR